MALEKFFHIQLVVPRIKALAFRDFLHQEGVLHLQNISGITKPYYSSKQEEQQVHLEISQVKSLINTFDKLFPKSTPFIENFIPNKPQFSIAEIQSIQNSFSIPSFYEEVKSLIDEEETLHNQIKMIYTEIQSLQPLEHLTIPFQLLHNLKILCLFIIRATDKQLSDLISLPFIQNNVVVTEMPIDNGHLLILFSKIKNQQDIREHLKRLSFDELDFKQFEGIAYEILASLKQKKNELETKAIQIQNSLQKLSGKKDLLILKKDILESQLNKIDESSAFAESQYVVMIDGYLPQSKQISFDKHLKVDYPDVFIQKSEDHEGPINFKNNGFFEPFEFIIRMFAIPRSGLIDPTPVVAIAFLILFGLSFGDVIYGLVLILICVLAIKKYKHDKGVVNFFKLFLYSGISACVFGVLTNSWAGDLLSATYLKPNHFLVKLTNSIKIINSLEQVMTLLIAILYLGAFVQMVGIFSAMLQNIIEKNYKDAIFDQLTWFVFIPSAFIFAGEFLAPGYYPGWLVLSAKYLLLVCLIFIFIGGAMKSRNPGIKVVKGLLNIYGIVSSYGVASILADVLSYLRLLALAVATASMAMSFNLISFLMKGIPVLGPIFVIVLLFVTNMLNFLLSILSAFIHPVRLIFYEFFGRFFQDGGTDYKPYSTQYKHVLINEEARR